MARLQQGTALDESESLLLFGDYGVPVLPHRIAEDADAALAAAREFGFPVAMKTAMPGILHKSDVGGVKLDLASDEQVRGAAMMICRKRLGPRVIVMPMAGKGVELAFGAIADPQFGPIVMAGAGGTLIEILADRRFAMPALDDAGARRLIDRLKCGRCSMESAAQRRRMLTAVAQALARFSVMIADLGDLIAEADVNPVLCGPKGCVALDALVVGRAPAANHLKTTEQARRRPSRADNDGSSAFESRTWKFNRGLVSSRRSSCFPTRSNATRTRACRQVAGEDSQGRARVQAQRFQSQQEGWRAGADALPADPAA